MSREITKTDIELTKNQIIEEHTLIFDNYRKLLSKAIAWETYVKQPNAGHFINKHNLSLSSVNQAFRVLKDKDLIIEEQEGFRIGDVFFM